MELKFKQTNLWHQSQQGGDNSRRAESEQLQLLPWETSSTHLEMDRKVKKGGKCPIGRCNNSVGGCVATLTSSRNDVSVQVCFPVTPTCSRGFVEGRSNDCYPTSPNLCGMASLEEQKSRSQHIFCHSNLHTHLVFIVKLIFFPCNFKKNNPTWTYCMWIYKLKTWEVSNRWTSSYCWTQQKWKICLYISWRSSFARVWCPFCPIFLKKNFLQLG